MNMDNSISKIDFEIANFKADCDRLIKNSKIVTCMNTLIRVELNYMEFKQLTICLRFPEQYPNQIILVELKSKTLSLKLLESLTKLCEYRAKEIIGKPQILPILQCVSNYLIENPLCIAYDEITKLRKVLDGSGCGEIKLKQKTSSVTLIAKGGKYFFKTKVTIPELYPTECVSWKEYESNLPLILVRFLNGQAKEIARRCVEPPLNKKITTQFVAEPSLYVTLSFLIEATNEFHKEICPICQQICLPENPNDVILNDLDDLYVERVLCGHIYHQGCLKTYIRNPPFVKGGKTCPALQHHCRADNVQLSNEMKKSKKTKNQQPTSCSIVLHHDRWGLNPRLAEARWAKIEARARELEEVKDFLQ